MTAEQLDQALALLGFENAANDAQRARLLLALEDFARETKNEGLAQAARGKMPAADPFRPPAKWLEGFIRGFAETADEDAGTDPGNARNSGVMLWQMQTDEWRRARIGDDLEQGREDGQEEAAGQNSIT